MFTLSNHLAKIQYNPYCETASNIQMIEFEI